MLADDAILSDDSQIDPMLHSRFRMYVSEAEFFEDVLASDVSKLPKGSHLVEIGAGIGLLALNFADKRFEVTAYEPEASGFTEMHAMRELILSNWVGNVPKVKFIDDYVDATTKLDKPADYMFAINVIEHVPKYEQLIVDALRLKSEQATLRLICPNYAIPYEPHLEIPIVFAKKLTWNIFKTRIAKSTIPNPIGFWRDLSWPTQRKLKKTLNNLDLIAEFSRDATNHYINRALNDSNFIKRKGIINGNCLRIFAIVAQHLTRFIPMSLIPIIDCRITGKAK